MDIDVNKIETLLAEKKYTEVQEIIRAAVNEKFSDEEEGAALVGMASAYMQISNAINIRYRDALKEAIEAMKKIGAAERKATEGAQLADVKSQLGM